MNMLDPPSAQLLANYRQWADQNTFEAVATLPPGEATKERPTHFKTIVGTLNHIYLMDIIWKAHLEGRDHGFESREVMLYEDLAELWDAQRKINHWYIDWSERQSVQSLSEIVRFQFIGGEPGAMTRGEILLHVINHATYHRGWIADLFFQVPARNPTTDLPVYLSSLRLTRPKPENLGNALETNR